MDYTAHTKTKRTRDQTLTSALHQVGSTNEHARHTLLASRSRWADVNLAASGRRGNVRDMPGSRDAWRNSYGTRSNGRDTGRDNVRRCNRDWTEIDAGVVITGDGGLRAGLTVGKAGAKGLEVSHSQSGMSTVE